MTAFLSGSLIASQSRYMAGAKPANGSIFRGEAMRGEYFTFQLGAYAARRPLLLTATWTDLVGISQRQILSSNRLRCTNIPKGSIAEREGLRVGAGEVLAFWFGLDVPKSGIVADTYVARVVLSEKTPRTAAGEVVVGEVVAEGIQVEIAISDALATQSGDNELWRHSRLRWLDSTVGDATVADSTVADSTVADEPAANGSSVKGGLSTLRGSRGCALGQADCIAVENAAHGTLLSAPGGRQLGIGSTGLPLSLRVGGAELLAAPTRLRLLRAHLGLTLSPDGPLHLERLAGGAVSWRQKLRAEEASVRVHIWGSMEIDGLAQMSAEIQIVRRSSQMSAELRRTAEEELPSNATIALDDVRLELPLLSSMVPLINGFDVKGNERPNQVLWRWDGKQTTQDHGQRGLNCRVWLGSASAGLQLNLQGMEQAAAAASSNCGNDENGQLQCENLSDAQFNVALGSQVGGHGVPLMVPDGLRWPLSASNCLHRRTGMVQSQPRRRECAEQPARRGIRR